MLNRPLHYQIIHVFVRHAEARALPRVLLAIKSTHHTHRQLYPDPAITRLCMRVDGAGAIPMRDDLGAFADTEYHGNPSPPLRETRTNAIAALRRAASNRENTRTPLQAPRAPPRSAARPSLVREGAAGPAPRRIASDEWDSASSGEQASSKGQPRPVEPAVQYTKLTELALDRPRLPTLDQLRRRIMQERATTGLSRSASTGAASQVARAYAMQKLLGATSPVPEGDMLSVVRGVNAARANEDSSEDQGNQKRNSRTLGVADNALYVSNAQSHKPNAGSSRETRKRATLMRSVSARDVARLHLFKKLERRRDGDAEHQQNSTAEQGGAVDGLGLSVKDDTPAAPAPRPASVASPEKARAFSSFSDNSSHSSTSRTDRSSEPTAIAIGSPQKHGTQDQSLPAPAPQISFAGAYSAGGPESQLPALSVAPAPTLPPISRSHSARTQSLSRQKPLPEIPSQTLAVPDSGSTIPSPTLMQSEFEQATVHTPISSETYAQEATAYYRSLRVGRSREETREDHNINDAPREESRGARLLGTLRRKTSRRGLADSSAHSRTQSMWDSVRSRSRHGKQASDVGAVQRVIVTLLGDRSGMSGTYLRHVELPITAATLVRWNRSLSEPFRDVLAHFPAEVPQRLALEPPRRLQRATPILLAVDDEYVKLRYAFVFDDVLLLLKTVPLSGDAPDAASHVMRRLASVPDLHEQFVPVDVVDLQRTEIHGLPPAELPTDAEMHRHMLPYVKQFSTTPAVALDAAVAGIGDLKASRIAVAAHLLYATPELEHDKVSRLLFDSSQRALLEAYVSKFHFAGIPVDASLRLLLLDVVFPRDMSAFEVLLLAFAAHWLQENRTSIAARYTLELVTDLTFALMALNDALHSGSSVATPSLFARRNTAMSPDSFVVSFRESDPAKVVSDHRLKEIYCAIKGFPLMSASAQGAPARTIYIDRATLPLSLLPGVPSSPISVSLDTPDPELRLELHGHDLCFDPPVLTFARSPTAMFRVASTSVGAHSMTFVRLGLSAPIYTGVHKRIVPLASTRSPACWVPLLREVPLNIGTRTAHPSLSLVHHTLRQGTLRYTLNLPDAAAMTNLIALLLDNQQRHAATLERMPVQECEARRLAVRVLQTALLGETALEDTGDFGTRRPGNAPVARLANAMPATTGLELVRIARENSLLYSILVSSD